MKIKKNKVHEIYIAVGLGTENNQISLKGKISKTVDGKILISPEGAITYPGGVRYPPEKTSHT